MRQFEPIAVYRPLPWQLPPLRDKSNVLLLTGSAGGGKALALDTEVPTVHGWHTMATLSVDDLVFGADGRPTAIVAVSDILTDRPCYRVDFSSGESVVADAKHQWFTSSVASRASRRSNPLPSPTTFRLRGSPQVRCVDGVVTTEGIAETVTVGDRLNHAIATCAVVQYPEQPVPVPPYVLGFLLGDGYLPGCSFTTADNEIVDFLREDLGPEYELRKGGNYMWNICDADGYRHAGPVEAKRGRFYKHALANCYVVQMRRPGGGRNTGEVYLGTHKTPEAAQAAIDAYAEPTHSDNELYGSGLRNSLRQMGIMQCRSADKFVPDIYKINSAEVRLAVLRGLMDADGSIDAGRGRCEFSSISKQLAADVFELLCGLGVKPTLQEKRATLYGKDCGPAWRVMFTDRLQVFRLHRKAERVKDDLRPTQHRRFVKSVTLIASVPVRCIQVAAPDGLFLVTRSYIATHNSRVAGEKIHAYCKHYPGSMALMMRKNRNSMTNSTVLFFEKTIMGDDPSVRHLSSKMRFEYANGSMLAYGGMADDEQREQIRSIGHGGGLDIAWLEEANRFSENDYNEVLGRIRGTAAPWRQVILTTNPDQPQHWIKRRLMDGGEATVYYSRAADNPHNSPDYLETLNKLTGILGKRLRDGLWVQAEGAVYEDFSDELHVIDPFPIPAEWRRIRAVDFGWTNPFVTQWWAIDPDGRMYLYREIYWTQRLVSDHAKQINLYSLGENIDFTVSDHDAEDRATLESEGIYTIPANKAVSPGLQAVAQRLKVAGDGRPRLFLFRDTLVERDPRLLGIASTLEEFPAYSWPESPDGRPIKEQPVKVFDHGCLVGDTVIAMSVGDKRLQDIRVGELVAGRGGWVQVRGSGMTQASAPIHCILLANGTSLYGTHDHPIYTENRGYIYTDSLRYGDMVWYNYSIEKEGLCYPSHIGTDPQRSLFTGGTSFGAILNRSVMWMRDIIVRRLRIGCAASITCIGKFTKTRSGRSRRDTKYTIETATRLTTLQKTSSVYLESTMANCISNSLVRAIFDAVENGSPKKHKIGRGSGTGRMRGASGIESMHEFHSASELPGAISASIAASPTRPGSQATPSIAAISAEQRRGALAELTARRAHVNAAASPSPSTGIASNGIALVPVAAVFAMNERKPVYNLTVDGGEYYANGILVHNCDTTRYAVMALETDGPLLLWGNG